MLINLIFKFVYYQLLELLLYLWLILLKYQN